MKYAAEASHLEDSYLDYSSRPSRRLVLIKVCIMYFRLRVQSMSCSGLRDVCTMSLCLIKILLVFPHRYVQRRWDILPKTDIQVVSWAKKSAQPDMPSLFVFKIKSNSGSYISSDMKGKQINYILYLIWDITPLNEPCFIKVYSVSSYQWTYLQQHDFL